MKECIHFLILLLLLNVLSLSAECQEPKPWPEVRQRIEQRLASIKSFKAYVLYSVFNNESYRKSQKEIWAKATDSEELDKFDPNRSISYFWLVDGPRWRTERNYNFPSRHGYYLDAFDGEKYTYYRQDTSHAWIADKISLDEDALTDLKNSPILGFDFLPSLERFEAQEGHKPEFHFASSQEISGIKCDVYDHASENYKIRIWVEGDSGLILKYEAFFLSKTSQGGVVYKVNSCKEINHIKIPQDVQLDSYVSDGNKMNWLFTKKWKINSCEVNLKVNTSNFTDVLRIGTPYEDRIENPGEIQRVGGDPSPDIEKLQRGDRPALIEKTE